MAIQLYGELMCSGEWSLKIFRIGVKLMDGNISEPEYKEKRQNNVQKLAGYNRK
jgi:hypothetical protein